jgi:hypothetical protein
MLKKIFDMLLLTMDTLVLNFTNVSPLLFPYLLSSLHTKNPDFKSADLFASNLAYYLGKTLGTYLTNRYIIKYGF